jgi:hypothetical protein
MHIKFWVGNLKERHLLEDPQIDADSTESKFVLVYVMRSYGGLDLLILNLSTRWS